MTPHIAVLHAADLAPFLRNRYLVKPLLPRSSLAVLFGQWGLGKTALAVDLACHIASGRPWYGYRTYGSRVCYWALENYQSIANRVCAWSQYHGVPLSSLNLDLAHGVINLTEPLSVSYIHKLLTEHPSFDLHIWDTLARATPGGDENSSVAMSALVAALDSFRAVHDCGHLIIHHPGKDLTKGARGHSSLPCAIDTEIELTEGEVRWLKQRDGVSGVSLGFGLEEEILGKDEDDDNVSTVVSIPVSVQEVESKEILSIRLWLTDEQTKGRQHSARTVEGAAVELGLTRNRLRFLLRIAIANGTLRKIPIPRPANGKGRDYYLSA